MVSGAYRNCTASYKVHWPHVTGIGMLAGIGFTVAIFVTDLSFSNAEYVSLAKLSIFIASAIAGITGLLILRAATSKPS